jgi:hypothetical protein
MDEMLEAIIERLRAAKLKYPTMRLGQILHNATGDVNELFYMTDKALLADLKFYMEHC